MTDMASLQELVDQYVMRGAEDRMPPELRQAVDQFKLRTDHPDQRVSKTTERRQLAEAQYEFKPQNEVEQGFADENARQQQSWLNQAAEAIPEGPSWTPNMVRALGIGAPELVRRPDLDTDDPNDGDVYAIGNSVFPQNLSREARYTDALDDYLPFGSETLGGLGSAAVDWAQGIGTLADSRTFGLGSDALEFGGRQLGFDTEGLNQAAEDFSEFVWQNDPKMAAAQTVAVGQTAANPRLMLRSVTRGAPAALGRVPGVGTALQRAATPISRGMLGTGLGRGALDATGAAISSGLALRGESGFDEDYVNELYDTDVMAPFGLESGITFRYGIPALAGLLPIAGGAVREVARQASPTTRAWRHASDVVDTDEMLAAAARGDDLRVADFAPEASRGAMPFADSEVQREFRQGFRDRAAARQSEMTDDMARRLGVDGYINSGTVNDDTLEFGRDLRRMREDEARGMYGQLDGERLQEGPLAPHLRDRARVPEHRDATWTNQDEARDLVRQGEEIGVGGDARRLEVAENRRPARGGAAEIPDDATLDGMTEPQLNAILRSHDIPYRRMYPNDDVTQPALLTQGGNPRVPSQAWKRERIRRLRDEIGNGGQPDPEVAAARASALGIDEAEEAWIEASVRLNEAERAVEAAQPRTTDPEEFRAWAQSEEGRQLMGELSTARSSANRARRNFTEASRAVDAQTFEPSAPGGSADVPVARLRALKTSTNDAVEAARKAGRDGEARSLSIYASRLRDFLEETVRNAAGVRVSMIGDRRWQVLSNAIEALERASGIDTKTGKKSGSGFFGMQPEEIRVMMDDLADARAAIENAPRLDGSVRRNLLRDFDLAFDAMRVGVVRDFNKLIQGTPFRRGASIPNDLHEQTAARLRMLFNDAAELDDFSRSLDVRSRQVDTEGRILGGPDTADKLATQGAFEQAAGDPQLGSRILGGVSGLADSLLIDVPAALYRMTRDRFYTGLSRRMANEFLRIMESGDLEAIAREIQAARAGGRPPSMANLAQRTQARVQQARAAAQAAQAAGAAPGGGPMAQPAQAGVTRFSRRPTADIDAEDLVDDGATGRSDGAVPDGGETRFSRRMDREGFRDEEVFDSGGQVRAQSPENRFEVDDQILQREIRSSLSEFDDPRVRDAMSPDQLQRLREIESRFQNRVAGGHRVAGLQEADARAGAGREPTGRKRRAPLQRDTIRPAAPDTWATDARGSKRQPWMLAGRGERTSLKDVAGSPNTMEINRFEAFEEGRRLLRDIDLLKSEIEIENLRGQRTAAAPAGRAAEAETLTPQRAEPEAPETPTQPLEPPKPRYPSPSSPFAAGGRMTRAVGALDKDLSSVRRDIRTITRGAAGQQTTERMRNALRSVGARFGKLEDRVARAGLVRGVDPTIDTLLDNLADTRRQMEEYLGARNRITRGEDLPQDRFTRDARPTAARFGPDSQTPGLTYTEMDQELRKLIGDSPVRAEIVDDLTDRLVGAPPDGVSAIHFDQARTRFKMFFARALTKGGDIREEAAHLLLELDIIPPNVLADMETAAQKWWRDANIKTGRNQLGAYAGDSQATRQNELLAKYLSRSEYKKKGMVGEMIRRLITAIRSVASLTKEGRAMANAEAAQRRFRRGGFARKIAETMGERLKEAQDLAGEGHDPLLAFRQLNRELASAAR